MNNIVKRLKYLFLLCRLLICSAEDNLTNVEEFPCYVQDFPFIVAVITYDKKVKCAGSLFDEHWVLTGAHCINEETEYLVMAGISNPHGKPTQVKVQRTLIHPDYNPVNRDCDIALLHLETPLPESSFIKYVVLPVRPFDIEYLNEICDSALVLIWKDANEKDASHLKDLECIFTPVLTEKKCSRMFQKSLKFAVDPCRLPLEGKNYCKGDTGGPLLCTSIQTGIVSWGVDCGISNDPAMFTRVDRFLDFLAVARGSGQSLNNPQYFLKLNQRSFILVISLNIFLLTNF